MKTALTILLSAALATAFFIAGYKCGYKIAHKDWPAAAIIGENNNVTGDWITNSTAFSGKWIILGHNTTNRIVVRFPEYED